jgi:hypothetical protein
MVPVSRALRLVPVPGGLPFGRYLDESPAVGLELCGIAGERLPTLNSDINVLWHQLDGVARASSHLGGDDRCSGPAERFVDRLAGRGVVLDRPLHAFDWLLRRVAGHLKCQTLAAFRVPGSQENLRERFAEACSSNFAQNLSRLRGGQKSDLNLSI